MPTKDSSFYLWLLATALISINVLVAFINLTLLPDYWLFLGFVGVSLVGFYLEYREYRRRIQILTHNTYLDDDKIAQTPPIDTQPEIVEDKFYKRVSDIEDYF